MSPRVSTEPSLTPDTPRDHSTKKRELELLTSLATQRTHYERQMAEMREKYQRLASKPVGPEPREVAGLRHQIVRLEDQLKVAALDVQSAQSRVAAGAERRKDAMITLVALLRCEDDPMDDAEWERRMDTVIRHARRIVTAERNAALVQKST